MRSLRNSNGFTLIEALVVSLIAAIVGGFFVAFMRMHNRAVNEGAARSIMQMRADIVSSAIAARVRGADQALAADEGFAAVQTLAVRDVDNILLYDRAGVVNGAYRIENGILMESGDGAVFQPFLSGGEQVKVAVGSAFRLSANRKEVTLFLKIALLYRNTNYEIPAKGDMYLCRN